MNDYIEKKGVTSRVYTQTGRNDFTSRDITTTDNIDEVLASGNRLEVINNSKNRLKHKLDKLTFEKDLSKLLNRLALGFGVVLTLIARKVNASSFECIPYLLGGIVTFAPAVYYNTFGKILKYNEEHKALEEKLEYLSDTYKREYNKNVKLNKSSKKSPSFCECKEVADRHYLPKYEQSRTVKRLRNMGYTDDEIEDYFVKTDASIKQQNDIYSGHSFEEQCEIFEEKVNAIHLSLNRENK